ncbi:MAG: type IX secretion system protein PorQ [Bacteroidetes bacterium]|nr:type IX secretion system protein PorQ [Bacteroidota bacterium]
MKRPFALHTITLILIILSFRSTALAGDRPTFLFLQHDVSARAAAMAGSVVSMAAGPAGVFTNPATIGLDSIPLAEFGYTSHLLDINAGFAAYSQPFSSIGVMGFGIQYVNYGTFDQTDDLANKLGTFTAGDLAASVTLSQVYEENLFYGVTGKFIYSSIADARSSAVAADLGLLYLIPGNDPIALGVTIANIGAQFDAYVDTREPLPLDIRIGGTIKPQHLPLQLNLNFHKLNEERTNFMDRFTVFTVGGEFTLSKALRFRFGYNNERRKELKISSTSRLTGFTFGGGLVLKKLRLDYSYNAYGILGNVSRIAVAMDI